MSGETYTVEVRIPTARERAQSAAVEAYADQRQGTATPVTLGTSEPARLRETVLAITRALEAKPGVVSALAGTARLDGPDSASMPSRVGGIRSELDVKLDATNPERAVVTISYQDVSGSCADQQRALTELVRRFVAEGLDPSLPTAPIDRGGAGARPGAGRRAQRPGSTR